MTSTPSIACIGVIGKHDNPLHISTFPPHASNPSANLHFSLLLNSSLDIFEERTQDKNRVDQDLGCLQNIDERLSIWGWETGTGARFAIIVDVWGKEGRPHGPGRDLLPVGVKDSDLRPAFRALQTAYIRLVQNPFYIPDDHTPMAAASGARGKGGMITSRRFIQDVERIGNAWRPGLGFV